ncbi:MAG: plasmid pRiA4b ORF-3 family protein, partial [Myxococcaceae bacterium]
STTISFANYGPGVPRRTRKAPTSIFQLKVTLQGVQPAVWRRLLVPADIALARLRMAINEAMGWWNAHLHQFRLRDRTFGDPSVDDTGDLEFEDERRAKLNQLVGAGQALVYEYDFGDGWDHEVLVEEAPDVDERLSYPVCIGGARACPPEDCGGTGGYENLLAQLADPSHEEHDSSLTWVGGHFDPEGFDVNRTNRALRDMR